MKNWNYSRTSDPVFKWTSEIKFALRYEKEIEYFAPFVFALFFYSQMLFPQTPSNVKYILRNVSLLSLRLANISLVAILAPGAPVTKNKIFITRLLDYYVKSIKKTYRIRIPQRPTRCPWDVILQMDLVIVNYCDTQCVLGIRKHNSYKKNIIGTYTYFFDQTQRRLLWLFVTDTRETETSINTR